MAEVAPPEPPLSAKVETIRFNLSYEADLTIMQVLDRACVELELDDVPKNMPAKANKIMEVMGLTAADVGAGAAPPPEKSVFPGAALETPVEPLGGEPTMMGEAETAREVILDIASKVKMAIEVTREGARAVV